MNPSTEIPTNRTRQNRPIKNILIKDNALSGCEPVNQSKADNEFSFVVSLGPGDWNHIWEAWYKGISM